MSVPQPVPKWDVDTVANFISGIGLPQLVDAFKSNAVNGADLIALSDDDFTSSLGCTPLQMKKIRRELEAYGIHSESTGGSMSSAQSGGLAAPPPAAEPVPAPTAPAAPAPVPVAAPAPEGRSNADVQAEIAALSARAAEVQRGAQAYATAQQHLRRADQELGTAAGCLTITQASGATETIQDLRIGGRGGGLFGRNRHAGHAMDRRNDFGHNMIEMGTINRANKNMKDAANEIQMAKQVVPQMPFIQPANVQQAMSGTFFNMFFTGLVGDMMQAAKVNKAKAGVQEMRNQVKQALDWCVNNMTAAQAEAAQIQGALMAKQSAMR